MKKAEIETWMQMSIGGPCPRKAHEWALIATFCLMFLVYLVMSGSAPTEIEQVAWGVASVVWFANAVLAVHRTRSPRMFHLPEMPLEAAKEFHRAFGAAVASAEREAHEKEETSDAVV